MHSSFITCSGMLWYDLSIELMAAWMLSAPCSPINPNPTLNAWHDVCFQHVHLGKDVGLWKFFPIKVLIFVSVELELDKSPSPMNSFAHQVT